MFEVIRDLVANITEYIETIFYINDYEICFYIDQIVASIITIGTITLISIIYIKILLIPHKLIHKAYHKWENKKLIKRGKKE